MKKRMIGTYPVAEVDGRLYVYTDARHWSESAVQSPVYMRPAPSVRVVGDGGSFKALDKRAQWSNVFGVSPTDELATPDEIEQAKRDMPEILAESRAAGYEVR